VLLQHVLKPKFKNLVKEKTGHQP